MLHQKEKQAAELLKSLSNPFRLQVLWVLSKQPCGVKKLNSQIQLSQSALSQHLARLRKESLVTTQKHAQEVTYTLQSDAARDILRVLETFFCPVNPKRNTNHA